MLPVPLFSVRPEKEGQKGYHTTGEQEKSPVGRTHEGATAKEGGLKVMDEKVARIAELEKRITGGKAGSAMALPFFIK